jgi:hypothetical protein
MEFWEPSSYTETTMVSLKEQSGVTALCGWKDVVRLMDGIGLTLEVTRLTSAWLAVFVFQYIIFSHISTDTS